MHKQVETHGHGVSTAFHKARERSWHTLHHCQPPRPKAGPSFCKTQNTLPSQKGESSSCAQERFFQKMQDLALNHYTKNYWIHETEQSLFFSPVKWALNMGHKRPLTSCSGVPENLAVPQHKICFRITKLAF